MSSESLIIFKLSRPALKHQKSKKAKERGPCIKRKLYAFHNNGYTGYHIGSIGQWKYLNVVMHTVVNIIRYTIHIMRDDMDRSPVKYCSYRNTLIIIRYAPYDTLYWMMQVHVVLKGLNCYYRVLTILSFKLTKNTLD